MGDSMRTWPRRLMTVVVGASGLVVPLAASAPANAASSLCGPAADTVPPAITGLTFGRKTVDLSSGDDTVKVTISAVDASSNGAASGVKSFQLLLKSPSHAFTGASGTVSTLRSGTARHGTWTGSIVVPPDTRPGKYVLVRVIAEDVAGNSQSYSNGRGATASGPTDIKLQKGWDTTITVTGKSKPEPPPSPLIKAGRLVAFNLTPGTVNTTQSAKTVHLTATFTSPQPKLVGVEFATRGYEPDVDLKRISGRHWAGNVRIPTWVPAGKSAVSVSPVFGRKYRPHEGLYSAEELKELHFTSELSIASNPDTTAPALTSLTISPTSIDTTSDPVTATLTATASDDHSGVDDVYVDVSTSFDSGGSTRIEEVAARLSKSGNKWVGTVTFARCVVAGSWTVSAHVTDHALNLKPYSSQDLAKDGLLSQITVTSTPGDIDPPFVSSSTANTASHTITLGFDEGVKNVNPSTLSVYAITPTATRFHHASTISAISCSNGPTAVGCAGSNGLVTSAVLTVPSLTGGHPYDVLSNLKAVTPQLTDAAGNPMPWSQREAQVTAS